MIVVLAAASGALLTGVLSPAHSTAPTSSRFGVAGTGAATLNVTPSSDYVGTFVNLTGGGYAPDTVLSLTFEFVGTLSCVPPVNDTTNATGNVSCEFQVPSISAGTYFVNATDGVNASSFAFEVLAPSLVLQPPAGPVDSVVLATGSGYDPGTPLSSFEFGAYAISCIAGSLVANGTGGLDCSFVVPAVTQGVYTVEASATAGEASVMFTVTLPTLTLVPTAGHVGDPVAASGTGYGPDQTIAVRFGTYSITAAACSAGGLTTNASGAFSCTFGVPPDGHGMYLVTASDANNTGFANFTIDPAAVLSASSGEVGSDVSVTGEGFDASHTFSVEWNASTVVCTGSTNATGHLACTFTVPHAPAGADSISIVAGTSSVSTPFSVVPSFDFAPSSGPVGTQVDVLGAGYDASQPFNVTWDGTLQVCLGTTTTVGDLTCSFFVPDATAGSHNVTANEGVFSGNVTFTVETTFSISPTSGIAGTTVTLSGSGFAGSQTYSYCFSATRTACSPTPTFTTNATGSIPSGTTIAVPNLPTGPYYVVVSLGAVVEASASYTITSAIVTLSPPAGPVGTLIGLAGAGYLPLATYEFCLNASAGVCPSGADTFQATASGTIPAGTELTVPSSPYGTYYVNVLQVAVLVASAAFQLEPLVTLAPPSGSVGATIGASGNGLDASTPYVLDWGASLILCSGMTSVLGAFSCSFAVPAAPAGANHVNVTSGALRSSAVFTVVPSVQLLPATGPVGSTFTVQGTGFGSSVSASAWWNGTLACASRTSAAGSFSCVATVPAGPAGPYPVNATDGPDNAAADFTVVPSLDLSASSGFAGSSISATGAGFDASHSYTLSWDSVLVLCSGTTAFDGSFGCTFTVPTAVGGAHTVTASEGSFTPSTSFTVSSTLSLSPSSGSVGSSVTASGTGFAGASAISVIWGGVATACSEETQSDGTFGCSFVVPAGPAGPVSVQAIQGSSEAVAQFVIGPSLGLASSSGPVGATINVSASGLAADAAVTIDWSGGLTVCSGTSSSIGAYSCSFLAPASPAGAHSVSVVQSEVVASTDFTILPAISASASSGSPGDSILLTGSGFDANAAYTVSWNSSGTLCSGTTNATGGFTCNFTVPAATPAGPHTLTITEGSHTVTQGFTVAVTPPPPPSANTFPWWLIAVIATVGGVLLFFFLLGERGRRRPSGPSRGSARPSPWDESAIGASRAGGGPGFSAPVYAEGPVATSPEMAVAAAPVPEGPEDIDQLILRLERMSEQLYKKKPSELGDTSAELPIDEEQAPPPQ